VKRIVLACALTVPLNLTGLAQAATITLDNGDTLTGKVLSQNEEQLVLQHKVLGEITFQLSNVANIKMGPGEKQQSTDGEQAQKQAEQTDDDQEQTPEADTDSAPWESSFLPEWDKSLAAGISGSEGNSQTQSFNAQFQIKRSTEQVRTNFNNKYFYASSESETTQNEFSSILTQDWLKPGSPWFVFGQLGYEFDQFEAWRHRLTAYSGPGYTFIKEEDFEVAGRVGVGANYEFGNVNELTPEALLGGELVRWNITDRQTLTGQVTVFPSLEEFGEYRAVATAEWTVKIERAEGLSLKLGIEDEYESATMGDSKHNDFKYYGSLNYAF